MPVLTAGACLGQGGELVSALPARRGPDTNCAKGCRARELNPRRPLEGRLRASERSAYRSATTHVKMVCTAVRPGSSDFRTIVSS